MFDPLRAHLQALAATPGWPGCERLNAHAAALERAPRTAAGRPVVFVPPPADDANYELRAHRSGQVATRERNWHDLFNAVVWLAYPRVKAVINRLHAEAIPHERGQRSRLRDLLTLFDEGGAIVLCAEPRLVELVRGHRWRELFWEQRAQVLASMRILVLGHAVLEKALAPWPGVTCKALFVELPATRLREAPAALAMAADRAAARWLAEHAARVTPQALAPLPIFGYPGWHESTAHGWFYEDTRFFRPFRAERAAVKSTREPARQPLRERAEESPGSAERDAG